MTGLTEMAVFGLCRFALLAQDSGDGGGEGFLSGLSLTDLLLAAGILLITLSMLRFYKKRSANQKDPRTAANESIERNRQLRGVRHDLESLMVEIEEYAKRMGAQLDAKSVRLEKLLDEADQKLRAIEAQQGGATPPPAASPGNGHDPGREPSEGDTGGEDRATPQAPVDPLTRSVHELADQGHDAHAIAQQLDEHVGKVELILALRQQT